MPERVLNRQPESIELQAQKLRLVVYGDIGVGKTTLAMTFPRPLVIDTDDGLISVTYAAGGKVEGERFEPEGYRDLEALYYFIRDNVERYDTIVIDSIDELSGLLISELTEEHSKVSHDKRPLLMSLIPEQVEYLGNQQQVRKFLHLLKGLRRHIVITSGYRRAHTDERTGKYHPAGPDVAPSIQTVLGKFSSIFGHLVAGVTDAALGDDKPHRVLFTEPKSDRLAKSRFADHAPYVVDPTFQTLWAPVEARLSQGGQ